MEPTEYAEKPQRYFAGVRRDFIDALPSDPEAVILELGCGAGGTGEYALQEGKCGRYVGMDISPSAAEAAGERLSEVIVGDIETIQLPWTEPTFDVLIMSEVLEHLRDPWQTVEHLAALVKPQGRIMASSPNVSHHKVIRNLIQGKWELTESGVMDATHLRWFTPFSFEQMFVDAGVIVDKVEPLTPMGRKARLINGLTRGRARYLFMTQICLYGRKP